MWRGTCAATPPVAVPPLVIPPSWPTVGEGWGEHDGVNDFRIVW